MIKAKEDINDTNTPITYASTLNRPNTHAGGTYCLKRGEERKGPGVPFR